MAVYHFLPVASDETDQLNNKHVKFGPRNKMSKQILTRDGITLACGITGEISGVSFSQHTSLNTDIEEIFRSAFVHLHKIIPL